MWLLGIFAAIGVAWACWMSWSHVGLLIKVNRIEVMLQTALGLNGKRKKSVLM